MTVDPFFAVPRTIRPAEWFERTLPSLPLRLPALTLPESITYHVIGAGGGVWTVGLQAGAVRVQAGKVGVVSAQVAMSAAHFREAVAGALRDRLAQVLGKLGRPIALPDFSGVPHDPSRIAALAALRGSVAIEIGDRDMGEKYRYVLTLGDGPPALEAATTTVEVDIDDLAALGSSRTPPLKVLTSGKLRLAGDASLPMRILTALAGAKS